MKERREQENLQKAFNEIIKVRDKSGKQFLDPVQRMNILTKHVPPQTAQWVNSAISAEQAMEYIQAIFEREIYLSTGMALQ